MRYSRETNLSEFGVALPSTIDDVLKKHLLRVDGQEDVAFGLYKPSYGSVRFRALIHDIILPEDDERRLLGGKVEINPKFFKRCCKAALTSGSGLLLLHSHLCPGWQDMSEEDIATEQEYASVARPLTQLPFIGLTLGTDGSWSARMWHYMKGKYRPQWAIVVTVTGKRMVSTFNDDLLPPPTFKEIYKRTFTVWGETNHAVLARLKVGIIGLGSVGSIVAETLARMGIQRVVLIDFDEVQLHNLDRLLGSTKQDIGRLKAEVARRQMIAAATASHIDITVVPFGITEQNGYEAALDCDVLFSCVDRPWPREVLNHIAYNHLISVVDGGIRVRLDSRGRFKGSEWQAQTVGSERPCLVCLRVFTPSDAATERDGKLEDQSYLDGLPNNHDFKRNENIFPFSTNLASLEVLQFIEMATGIGGTKYYGTQRYVYNQGIVRIKERSCVEGCYYKAGIAMGDTDAAPPYSKDFGAEKARGRQVHNPEL